jgi:hypothetical protein
MDATKRREDKGQSESGWTAETEALLQDWRNRVYASQSAYYMETERLRRWHYLLGISVVIVSTVVGTTMFASKTEHPLVPLWVSGAVSALAAILAALQTFFRLAESAAAHGFAADWYAAIRRDIEQLQALPRHVRGNVTARLDGIRKEMNKAGQKAPELRESLWVSVAQLFGVKEPPLAGEHQREPSVRTPWKPIAYRLARCVGRVRGGL